MGENLRAMHLTRLAALVAAFCIAASVARAADPPKPTPSSAGPSSPPAMTPIEYPDWLFPLIPKADPPAPPAPAVTKPTKPDPKAPKPEEELLDIPDSTEKFPLSRINDAFNAPDWRPASHGPMPEVVAKGRKPTVMACAFCHTPTGQGRPENSALAGLPAAYIKQQLLDYIEHSKTDKKCCTAASNAITILV